MHDKFENINVMKIIIFIKFLEKMIINPPT
jgi:hypothetical protein